MSLYKKCVLSIFLSTVAVAGQLNLHAVDANPPVNQNEYQNTPKKHHSDDSSSSSSSSSEERGRRGHRGHRGHQGAAGPTGPIGPTGATGTAGTTGATGATGAAGSVFSAADFFALMPGDNAATVAAGTPVQFPQDGPNVGTDITRFLASPSDFNLASIGTYLVQFQVSVTEAGQLVISIDSGSGFTEQAYTVVGRATGTDQIVGMALITTTVTNTTLRIDNPVGNSTALTITPIAGGTHSVSAHLTIMRVG